MTIENELLHSALCFKTRHLIFDHKRQIYMYTDFQNSITVILYAPYMETQLHFYSEIRKYSKLSQLICYTRTIATLNLTTLPWHVQQENITIMVYLNLCNTGYANKNNPLEKILYFRNGSTVSTKLSDFICEHSHNNNISLSCKFH